MSKLTSTTFEELGFVSKVLMTKKVTIDSTALDAGNTGKTHELRGGLVMAYSTAASAYVHYQPAGSNGTDTADCILLDFTDLKDGDAGATSADKSATVLLLGTVKSGVPLLQDAAAIVDLSKAGGGEGWIEFV